MLHYREHARGVTLIVSGDGDLRSYTFHDFTALLNFQHEMEEFLVETGWSLSQATIGPRSGDQPAPPPPSLISYRARNGF
jgi:hypothetical protein